MRKLNKKTILLSTLLTSCLAGADFKTIIVDHAECNPVAENDRPSGGMRKNRRVDVTLQTTKIETKKVVQERTVHVKEYLNGGGIIWASSDPLAVVPHLDVKADTLYLTNNTGVTFYTYNNYSDFIKRYELVIAKSSDKKRYQEIKVLQGNRLPEEIVWEDIKPAEVKLHEGDQLFYKLKVYDKEGNVDETVYKRLLVENRAKKGGFRDIAGEIFGKSSIAKRAIPVYGARVRVYGSDIDPDALLKIDNQEVRVGKNGKFVYEQIKQAGHYEIPIAVMESDGIPYEKKLALDVTDNHVFMVGLADFTAGKYSVSGNIKPLEADDHYDEDIFVDGRLAFYIKGKVKGKYLITAQMDTGEGDIKDMFKNITKKDPTTVFRHLDPDQYYYVYGDDSTSYKDTDSMGKLYVRVDWDKSKAVWGNYNTSVTGNEFANINRSLYGAKLQYGSMKTTKYGDNKRDVILFASEAQSAYAHNAFEATGGSLYYLKNRDILQGSEKVWVEVMDRNSLRVAQKIELERGKDYEIDEIQGRIILTRPLTPRTKMSGPSIIKDYPLDGNRVVLKVDYEYLPDDFKANQATYGARVKQWLNDHIAVGATYGHEGRSNGDYEVKGADVTFKAAKNSYIRAEFASSDALQSNGANFYSMDGGLRFETIDTNNSNISGDAYGVEAKVALSDFKEVKNDTTALLWYKKRDEGFSNARLGKAQEVEDYGVEATSYLKDFLKITTRATHLKKGVQEQNEASVESDVSYKSLTFGAEVRNVQTKENGKTTGEGTLAGGRVVYKINSYYDVYVASQYTLDSSGNYRDNSLYTLGADVHLGKFTFNGEVSSGDRGDAVQIGADYNIAEGYNLYTNYILSTDSTRGGRNILTVGERSKLTDRLSVFSEHQFSHSDTMSGVGNSFGIDYAFSKYLTANVTYTKINYDDKDQRDRDALSVSLSYANKDVTASTKLEYRKDKSDTVDETQYVTTNRLSYRLNPSWRLMAKLNYSKTQDEVTNRNIATFTEAGVGFAYRPVENNRFNFIGKYTYLYDLSSVGQEKSTPDEKSHIVSAEMSYRLSSKWSIGSKVGMKRYSLRSDRDSGEWYESNLYLTALRLNYHLIKSWDALLELHMLSQEDDGDKRGFLAGIYKHIGDHVKLGVGYNFTDFSDDLTTINDYRAGGWFINVIGKF